jgi:hypothetical protein
MMRATPMTLDPIINATTPYRPPLSHQHIDLILCLAEIDALRKLAQPPTTTIATASTLRHQASNHTETIVRALAGLSTQELGLVKQTTMDMGLTEGAHIVSDALNHRGGAV